MTLSRAELDAFIEAIPERIRQDPTVWPAAPGSGESGHDQIAFAIRRWLVLLGNGSESILHAEGLSKSTSTDRPSIPVILREYKGGFGGSWNSPDIALIHPELRVAIEVDRGRGKVGASVRTAMTKGSFSVLTGKFDRCLVLIFQQKGRDVVLDEGDKKVLARFSTDFRTDVHFFPDRRGSASTRS